MRGRRVLVVTIGIVAAVGLPIAVERAARAFGPRRGPGIDAHIAQVVSQDALFGAELLNSGLARLIVRAHVVTRVWRAPGHCTDATREGFGEYRATVVSLTWFAVPTGKIHAICGGSAWSRIPLERMPPPTSNRTVPSRVTAPRSP